MCYLNELPKGQLADTLEAFAVGLRMDISVACYLMVIPLSLYLLASLFEICFKNRMQRTTVVLHYLILLYHAIMIAGATLICVVNIYIYSRLGTLLNMRILKYLAFPKDVLASLQPAVIIALLFAWILTAISLYILYVKIAGPHFVKKGDESGSKSKVNSALQLLYIPALIVGMRGGIQLTPLNESMYSYSNYSINNIMAANGIWKLGFSFLNTNDDKNPYKVFTDKKAKQIVQSMLAKGTGKSEMILNTLRPNVIIIMLESWTADVVTALGGLPHVTPCFDTLRRSGLLFTHAYASGSRTDHGLVSIISGFPAQPNHSIIMQPDKAKNLPFITDMLYKLGYHFSFYYGGDANFADMRIYLRNAHFSNINDYSSIDATDYNGKWGANDAFVYRKQLRDLDTTVQPFLSLVMTLSSHDPFEVPTHHLFEGKNRESVLFQNAIYYSDSCLGAYMAEAAMKPWYGNTLFIIVADHGHRLPLLRTAFSPEAHHITLLLSGGALKKEFRGKEISNATNQCDIAAMLYGQMQLCDTAFRWSKDVLNPTVKDFAFYINDNEAGIISRNQHLTYYLSNGTVADYTQGAISADSLESCARALLQLYYRQYLTY